MLKNPQAMRAVRALSLVAAAVLAGCASGPFTPPVAKPQGPVAVKVLAINDFHGNLKAPPGGIRVADPANPGKFINVQAGGAPQLATAVSTLRAQNPNHVFVAAGDLVGGTPLLSALFRDEPTIEALNLMGLEAAAMGNHELDRGPTELLRLQNGGCHPKDGCTAGQTFAGARFQYLAANTVVQATGKTLLPAVHIKTFQGVPVAFIGVTLEGTPSIVIPSGTAGLKFRDEADTVNELVPQLQKQGIEAIVLLIHEGGQPTGDYNTCTGISGPIVDIVKRLNKAVDLVISGHTHRAYNCVIDGLPVTSGDRYGTLITQIDLLLDPQSKDVISVKPENVIVQPERFQPDARVAELVSRYEALVKPLARRPVARLVAPFTTRPNPAGENSIGQLVADAQLAATKAAGAEIAFMNGGGLRSPLGGEGRMDIVYEDLFAVQPFGNQLVTMTVTGAQLLQLLNQQLDTDRERVLLVSRGLTYTWDAARPRGQRVLNETVRLNGQPVRPDQRIRITANNFIADGGDGFPVLRQGTERTLGPSDIDALEAYVRSTPNLAPDTAPRITRLN